MKVTISKIDDFTPDPEDNVLTTLYTNNLQYAFQKAKEEWDKITDKHFTHASYIVNPQKDGIDIMLYTDYIE